MRPALLLAVALVSLALPARAENPVVRFTTVLGSYDVELCTEVSAVCTGAVPDSVANFLGYVDRGDYEGSVIHRSTRIGSAGLVVVQGGGFRREAPAAIRPVPTQPPIQNTFMQSNLRGTMAYARGAQVNSATSQWFVNVQDHVSLDTNNGGFTVFGVVLGDGMEVVDAISALGRLNLDSPVIATHIDPLFGPDAAAISTAFREVPVDADFYDLIVAITDVEDLPPLVDFADAMIETQIVRVPETSAQAAAVAAVLVLGGLVRGRTR